MRLLPLLFVLICSQLLAQTDDLTTDTDFFQRQTKLYQRWLEHSGLGEVIKVEDIDVQPKEFSLYLSFPYQDTDSVKTAWRQLKADFEQKSPLLLEEELFYQMTNMMEVRQTYANVQLFDTYDTRVNPCFWRGIRFMDGQVQIDSTGCKSGKDRDIEFDHLDFAQLKESAAEELNEQYSRQQVFDAIYAYAQEYFPTKDCENHFPAVRLLENKRRLRFEATDLCREVLTNQSQPTLCSILQSFGYPCDWAKREMLTFTFSYEKNLDANGHFNGFLLTCNISGKYGSGFYDKVERGAYIDMEIDFDDDLEYYADLMMQQIREELLK